MTVGEIFYVLVAAILAAISGIIGVVIVLIMSLAWPTAFVIGCYLIAKAVQS